MKKVLRIAVVFLLSGFGLFAQNISVQNSAPYNNPFWLVQNVLMDNSVTAFRPYNSLGLPIIAPNTNQVGRFTCTNPNFGLDSGIVMFTDNANLVVPGGTGTSMMMTPSTSANLQSVLTQINSSATNLNDLVRIDFSFNAPSDSIKFDYIFGSQEYTGYTCSGFNDVFGFFLIGPGINGAPNNQIDTVNLAVIPGTSVPVAINTINQGYPSSGNAAPCIAANPNYVAHSVYYNANTGGSSIVNLEGFTDVFTAEAKVICGAQYTIRMIIADVSDGMLNSAVFLGARSFRAPTLNISQPTTASGSRDSVITEGCNVSKLVIERDGNMGDTIPISFTYSGNAISGVDYAPLPATVTLYPGMRADTLYLEALFDNIPEGVDTLRVNMQPITNTCATYPAMSVEYYIVDKNPVLVGLVEADRDTVFCPGQDVHLSGVGSGGEGQLYSWWESNYTNGDTMTVTPTQTTTYYYYVTDECYADTVVDSITIYLPNYIPMVPSNASYLICPGDAQTLDVNFTGGQAPFNTVWMNGNGGNSITVSPSNSTWYWYEVVDGCGVTLVDSIRVEVSPEPNALFTHFIDAVNALKVNYNNRSTNAVQYVWDFGDGDTAMGFDQIHVYSKPGTYEVTLRVINVDGCIDEYTTIVDVRTDFYLYVPTGFSPDDNRLNDVLQIQGMGFDAFHIQIYNRWGGLVYESHDINEAWDGTSGGVKVPEGVYSYVIRLELPFDEFHEESGFFTLFR